MNICCFTAVVEWQPQYMDVSVCFRENRIKSVFVQNLRLPNDFTWCLKESVSEPFLWLIYGMFEKYHIATKLDKDKGAVQVSCLIHEMGSEVQSSCKSFVFTEDRHHDDFAIVLQKFDECFIPRRNVIHEPACFHQCVQKPEKKADSFIRSLYDLSELCEFGVCWDESIRNHIFIRILEKEISCRLPLMRDMMQAWMTKTVRQLEEVASHVNMQGETAGTEQQVTHTHSKLTHKTNHKGSQKKNRGGDERKCGNCDKIQHSKAEHCPTRRATCNNFHKMEHWTRVCRNRKPVREITTKWPAILIFGLSVQSGWNISQHDSCKIQIWLQLMWI